MSSIVDVGSDLLNNQERPVVKPVAKVKIPIEDIPEEFRDRPLSAADIKAISEHTAEILREKAAAGSFSGTNMQVTTKKNAPIDWSKITQDDVYNSEIFIEARPFMAGDPLKVTLKDQNYEARWVNKKSERLGYMLSIGFTYVVPEDLATSLEVEVGQDASGHFSFHDVVLMRIPKNIYYPALRAAQNRANLATQATKASHAGLNQAARFMANAKDDTPGLGEDPSYSSIGGDFVEATRSKQMEFYTPGA